MVDSVTIGNFKAFGTPQTVPIKPITLIFGANSAGKSSILHSLLFAHESARTGDLDVRQTQIGGNSVDLGGFEQLVYRRDLGRAVTFSAAKFSPSQDSMLPLKDVEIRAVLQTSEVIPDGLGAAIVETVKKNDPEFDGYSRNQKKDYFRQLIREVSEEYDEKTGFFAGEGNWSFNVSPILRGFEIFSEGQSVARVSSRPDKGMRIDRLETGHPAIREAIRSLVLANTTTDSFNDEDAAIVAKVFDDLVPGIELEAQGILCRASAKSSASPLFAEPAISAISKGSRSDELANLARLFFPRLVAKLFEAVCLPLSSFLKSLQYLGPLRAYPPRHISLDTLVDEADSEGLNAWKVVLREPMIRKRVNDWLGSDFLQTKYELGVKTQIPSHLVSEALEGGIADMLAEMKERFEETITTKEEFEWPGEDVAPEDLHAEMLLKIGERCRGSAVRELTLRDRGTGTLVSHRDIGIGVSQLLPVLVKAYASKNAVIAIEQPEIHLHPALQAELADVFIESALGEQKNTYILETHSEHLILRLLRRIRQTAEKTLPAGKTPIRPEDVAILYVKPSKEGSRVVCLPPNSEGDFDHQWPDGFFAERAKELF